MAGILPSFGFGDGTTFGPLGNGGPISSQEDFSNTFSTGPFGPGATVGGGNDTALIVAGVAVLISVGVLVWAFASNR